MNLSLDLDQPKTKPKRKISILKLLLIILLVILVVISFIHKLKPTETETVTSVPQSLEHVGGSLRHTRINGCDFNYDSDYWLETVNGLEGKLDTGYYQVDMQLDTLSGFALNELVDTTVEQVGSLAGVELNSTSDYSTETGTRLEVSYSRIEVNVNHIVTGNSELTTEIFIQPIGSNNYFHISTIKYITDDADYTAFDESLEQVIASLTL